jgi:hypothetical protein
MSEEKNETKPKTPDLRKTVIACARRVAREMPLTAAMLVWGGGSPGFSGDRELEALAARGAGACGFGPTKVYPAALKLANYYEELDQKSLETLSSLRAARPDQQPSWMLELAVDTMERVLRGQKNVVSSAS